MNITEIRIKLISGDNEERLQGFACIILDDGIAIRDFRIIATSKNLLIGMPSRKLTDHCEKCHGKNELRARYCCQCGTLLPANRAEKEMGGRSKLYADIVHPINNATRKILCDQIIAAYHRELELSKVAGYECTYDIRDGEIFSGNQAPPFTPHNRDIIPLTVVRSFVRRSRPSQTRSAQESDIPFGAGIECEAS